MLNMVSGRDQLAPPATSSQNPETSMSRVNEGPSFWMVFTSLKGEPNGNQPFVRRAWMGGWVRVVFFS